MKITRVFVFLVLIIVSSVSIASAQLQVTTCNRGVISRLYLENTGYILDSEWVNSLEMGEYSGNVELPVDEGVLTASQNSLLTNESYTQALASGHLQVSVSQPAADFPNGMDSESYVQFLTYSPFITDYSLSGTVSGPGQVTLRIKDWVTSEVVSTETWSEGDFSTSAQLPPGTYFYHLELLDYVYGDAPVSRKSGCEFDLIMTPEMSVATDEISFGAVKALFR